MSQEVENWWKTESFGTKFNCDVSRSTEDERALKRLEETINFRVDLDHYETGLLWKDEKVVLPNNRPLAERRLTNLERSLDKDSERAKAYYDTVESYIAKDSYLSDTLTNLCIALFCILLYCVVLNCIVLLIYCYVDIIQYNAMHKFVGVLDNPPRTMPESYLPQRLLLRNPRTLGTCRIML